MPLTVKEVMNAQKGPKDYKLADSGGLHLYVTTKGAKSWRFKYRYAGKEKRLTFGLFPEVTLAEARDRRDEARLMLRAGRDPVVELERRKHEAIAAAGVRHPGHTEILAELAGVTDVRMMLANDELRTILVTIHVPLRAAIDAITREAVRDTIAIADAGLRRLGIARPRIAVAGLNPHAGEGGLMGREEIESIAPAIADARAAGIDASGPWPGDTVFMRARHFRDFDVVVAMYHDQGLIPVKYLGVDTGVNVTVGLPFVRTSVDHGTAFDIAGHGVADHRSLLAAIDLALKLAPEPDAADRAAAAPTARAAPVAR